MSEQGYPISLGSVWEEETRKPRAWATAWSQSLRFPCPSVLGPSTARQPQEWRVDLVSGLRPDTAGAVMHAKEAEVDFRRSEWEPCACSYKELRPGISGALGLPCPLWQQHSMKTEHQRSLDCTWLSAIRACGWSRSFTVSDPTENQSFRMFQCSWFGAGPQALGGSCSSH